MKHLILTLLILSLTTPVYATYVRPHVTKNGTYVQGHYRSKPNKTKLDNYSYKMNRNPYTGKKGTKGLYKYGY